MDRVPAETGKWYPEPILTDRETIITRNADPGRIPDRIGMLTLASVLRDCHGKASSRRRIEDRDARLRHDRVGHPGRPDQIANKQSPGRAVRSRPDRGPPRSRRARGEL